MGNNLCFPVKFLTFLVTPLYRTPLVAAFVCGRLVQTSYKIEHIISENINFYFKPSRTFPIRGIELKEFQFNKFNFFI